MKYVYTYLFNFTGVYKYILSKYICMDHNEEIKAKLLFKLARRRKWGNSHTAFDNLNKGFKPKDHEKVKRAAEQLIKENYLLKKPTGYGLHVSLNHKKAKEIKATINELLGVRIE